MIVGETSYPILPPFLDKVGLDGVARYDYFVDAKHQDPDFLEYLAELQTQAAVGDKQAKAALEDPHFHKPGSANPLYIPARQSFRVTYEASTKRCYEVLQHPETLARVWLVGERTRDVQ